MGAYFACLMGPNWCPFRFAIHSLDTTETSTAKRRSPVLTHEVHNQLAHASTEHEVPHEVGDEREGDADQRNHQVGHGQRQQEQVGDRPHAPVAHQHGDDEGVAEHAEEEDEAVQHDADRLIDVWIGSDRVRESERERE